MSFQNLSDHLDKLVAFKEIATCGKIREAAEKLNLTQPALTRLIQKLEDSTQTTLFYRSRAGVALTPAGEELFIYSKKVLKDLSDLEARLKNPKDLLAGNIKIGSYETLAEYLWPDFLLQLKKEHPTLNISVTTNGVAKHFQLLIHDEIDIVVDAEPRETGDFMSWTLYEDRFRLYAHKKLNFKIEKGLVQNIPLIYVPEAYVEKGKKLSLYIEELDYYFKEKIELDSFASVKTFCRKGLGIGVLPQRLYQDDSSTSELKQIELAGIPSKGFGIHNLYATVKAHRITDARIQRILKMLRSWY